MTFLNPLVLFGLAAAAIPIILHLLNLRKLRTIEFSTLTFLKELQQTKIRRLKLRQLLLLLVRTLLVAFIVLGFARPALRGTFIGGLGTHAHSTVLIILDDSFSMMGSDEHGEFFKQAKDATLRLVDLLKDGDEAFLVRLSDLPAATVDPATHDFDLLRTVVSEAQISSVRRPMGEALSVAANLLKSSVNANKEVYLISDLQATLFADKLRNEHEVGATLDEQTKFFIVNVGSKTQSNAGLDSVEVLTKILERDKPATVFASARNFGPLPLRDYVVSVFLDETRAAQGNISLDPWGSGTIELTVTPKRSGFVRGYVELETDALETDDRRYFTLSIPDRINVAMVADSPADARFLQFALDAAHSEGRQVLLNLQHATSQRFPLLDLKAVDVLILSNVRSFSSSDVDRITEFVKRGGGVVIFPGPNVVRENYNSTLLPALNVPSIEGITNLHTTQAGLSFQSIDLDHPLFATVFEKEQPGIARTRRTIESPSVFTTLKRNAGRHGRGIITLSDGSSFLSEHTIEEGRVLFYSVAPLLSWSDFPLKGIFAPLVYRSVIYTSGRGESLPRYEVGQEPTLTLRRPPVVTEQQYRIVSPDGTEELIQPSTHTPRGSASALAFSVKRLTQAGFYELQSGPTPLTVLAVNTDARESDMRKAGRNDLESFWKRLGIPESSIHTTQPDEQLQTAIFESRFGVELWKYCIGLALILALVEMLIARDGRKALQQIPSQ